MTNFVIGLVRVVVLVFTLTDRTRPSQPVLTSTILARGHKFRGMFSSHIKTMSPTETLGRSVIHFCVFAVQVSIALTNPSKIHALGVKLVATCGGRHPSHPTCWVAVMVLLSIRANG